MARSTTSPAATRARRRSSARRRAAPGRRRTVPLPAVAPARSEVSGAVAGAACEAQPVTDPAEERPVAVFDVDGVVADVRHRLHHLSRRPKNWGAFFAAAGRDPVLDAGVQLAREYATGHRLVWLTGRPEHLRPVTEHWLTRHGLPVA